MSETSKADRQAVAAAVSLKHRRETESASCDSETRAAFQRLLKSLHVVPDHLRDILRAATAYADLRAEQTDTWRRKREATDRCRKFIETGTY